MGLRPGLRGKILSVPWTSCSHLSGTSFKVLYREWPPCSIWTVACECDVQLGGYSSNFSSPKANFQRSARYGMTPLRPRNV